MTSSQQKHSKAHLFILFVTSTCAFLFFTIPKEFDRATVRVQKTETPPVRTSLLRTQERSVAQIWEGENTKDTGLDEKVESYFTLPVFRAAHSLIKFDL